MHAHGYKTKNNLDWVAVRVGYMFFGRYVGDEDELGRIGGERKAFQRVMPRKEPALQLFDKECKTLRMMRCIILLRFVTMMLRGGTPVNVCEIFSEYA